MARWAAPRPRVSESLRTPYALLAMPDAVRDLLDYIDASPSPYHAVRETARRLEAAGYEALGEADAWTLAPGDRRYVVRGDGSVIAFEMGREAPVEAGFRVVGAHTDSPNLRIRPRPEREVQGTIQWTVEPYGGVLQHTWFDRDLSVAGRVRVGTEAGPRTYLVDLERPLLRIPNLAIHLNRTVNTDGFQLNPQQHLVPLAGLEGGPDFLAVIAQALADAGAGDAEGVLAYDLMLYDVQPAAVSGIRGEFVHAARLDNLASCHAGLSALLAQGAGDVPDFTRAVAFWDHEEVGSRSAQGAAGSFLRDVLARVAGGDDALRRAVAHSAMISADMAHAVHPNYPERHDPDHMPKLGKGRSSSGTSTSRTRATRYPGASSSRSASAWASRPSTSRRATTWAAAPRSARSAPPCSA